MKTKYSLFFINKPRRVNYTDTEQKIRCLFALVMLMKVRDDANDKNSSNVDGLLGIPNFFDYANQLRSSNGLVLEKITEKYMEVARGQFPMWLQSLAVGLSSLTSQIKSNRAKQQTQITQNRVNFGYLFSGVTPTTTLRHQLAASSILTELFS